LKKAGASQFGVTVFLAQSVVAASKPVGGGLGLALAGEDPLLVAQNSRVFLQSFQRLAQAVMIFLTGN